MAWLSYRRAAELFERATAQLERDGAGWTLHKHRSQLLQVAGVLGKLGRHDHLLAGGDPLGVVALHLAIAGGRQAAVGVGEVGGGLRLGRLVTSSGLDGRPGLLALGPGRAGQATVFTQPVSGHSQGVLLAMAAAPQPEQPGLLDEWFGRHVTVGDLGEPAPPTHLGLEGWQDRPEDRPSTVLPGPSEHHPGSFHQRTRRAAHLRNHPALRFPPDGQQAP